MTPLEIAQEYVARERPYCHAVGLIDLGDDYLVATELNDPRDEWPLGPAALLIAKSTNEVRDECWGDVIPRLPADS